jgi:hypothetical protein
MTTTFSVDIDEKLQKDFVNATRFRNENPKKVLTNLMYYYITFPYYKESEDLENYTEFTEVEEANLTPEEKFELEEYKK